MSNLSLTQTTFLTKNAVFDLFWKFFPLLAQLFVESSNHSIKENPNSSLSGFDFIFFSLLVPPSYP